MPSPSGAEPEAVRPDPETLWIEAALAGLEPPPVLSVSEWADRYRILTGKTAAEAGPWSTDRTPYLREIMDQLSVHSPADRIVVMKGSQVGCTEAGNNWLGYVIHHAPGPMLYVEPRIEDARKESKQRIAPMLAESEVLSRLVAGPRTRYGDNTLLLKEFPGGFLAMTGANSAAGFRRIPIRYLFCDEIDGYPPDVGGEGDPLELAIRRTATFEGIRKLFLVSTPTIKDLSRIEKEFLASDQRRYYVPCPHCGAYQTISWCFIRWPEGHPELAHMDCTECGAEIDEAHKGAMLSLGAWRATAPGAGRPVGYHLSALYSPPGWYSWGSAARDFLTAKVKGREALQTWINTVLGEVWEEEGVKVDEDALVGRVEKYQARVPAGAMVLTLGADVQDDRIEAEVVAWGPGEESWGVEYRVLRGDTSREEVWERLGQFLQMTWTHQDGYPLSIAAACIDSGHRALKVYRFVQERKGRMVFAVKGSGLTGLGVVEAPSRKRTGRGQRHVELWTVGDDQASSIVHGRLKVDRPGPGYCHFPADGNGYDHECFRGLTSMKVVIRYTKGRPRREWVLLPGRRNEAFDCRKYSLAALYILNPDWIPLAKNRQRLADRALASAETAAPESTASTEGLDPKPSPQQAPPPKPRPIRVRRPGSSWVTGWRN
jgi:phage terminase large subunit GpA-like protein